MQLRGGHAADACPAPTPRVYAACTPNAAHCDIITGSPPSISHNHSIIGRPTTVSGADHFSRARAVVPPNVVLADDTPLTTHPPDTAAADPFTPISLPVSPSTRPSAPDNPTQTASRRSALPPQAASNAIPPARAVVPASTPVSSSRRRRRSSTPTDHPLPSEPVESPPEAPSLDHPRPRVKRRRRLPRMRSDEDSKSAHASPRPVSNGAVSTALRKAAPAATNGTHKATAVAAPSKAVQPNGASLTSPAVQDVKWCGHDREEITRILIQALGDLGYAGAAATLGAESGFELESPIVAAFRTAVLQGEWAEAEALLFGSSRSSEDEGGVSIHGTGLALAEGTDKNMIRFWMRRQKFLELLELRDTGRALMVLRTELTPLYQNTDALHFLSSLLMCQSVEDIKSKADWDGALGGSRHQLLSELSKCISPSVMLPEHRLAVLLQQVKQSQISSCLYHNSASSPSLLYDHMCDHKNFPLLPILNLEEHTNEVWQTQFSHDGKRLATCGLDGTAIIYDTDNFEVLHTLRDHEKGVCSLAWSPDDKLIVTCSKDARARLWDTETGELLRSIRSFQEPVSSCVWHPDGQSFVTGCLGTSQNLCQWSVNGSLIHDWKRSHRIQDVALSPDARHLVAMDNEKHLWVYDFHTRELEYSLDLKVKLSSVSISQDSKYMLVNQSDGQARLFDLESQDPVRAFAGQKAGEFIIRSEFGGANEAFVVSGSEDGHIFIWHKENGALVKKLDGHRHRSCNSVSWNPANSRMFASAGDDYKVRIWSNEVPDQLTSKNQAAANGSHRATNFWSPS